MTLHDVTAVVHVHSTYSDGMATVPEILAAARANGVEAVLLTDHDTLGAQRDGWEGWHDGVLLLVGHEVSPKGGHLLVFGAPEPIPHAGRSEEEIAAAARDAGALTFPAHPFSEGSRISRRIAPPHGWRALADRHTGIELWSFYTDEAERARTLRELATVVRAPERLDGPPDEHLAVWDRLCAERRVVGIGGLDAHQRGVHVRGRYLGAFRYERAFGLLHTHFLLEQPLSGDDVDADRAAIYGALGEGRCYLALDSLAPAEGFGLTARRDGEELPMGAEAPLDGGGWRLHVRSPRRARLRLVRDGVEVAAGEGEELEHDVAEPGVYRAEAALAQRRWTLTNPIYLRATG